MTTGAFVPPASGGLVEPRGPRRWARYPAVTPEELGAFVAWSRERFARRYVAAAPGGAAVAAAFAVGLLYTDSRGWVALAAVTSAGLAVALALLAIVGRSPRVARLSRFVSPLLGSTIGLWAGLATGVGDGFGSPGAIALLLLWMYGCAVVPHAPEELAPAIVLEAGAFAVATISVRGTSGWTGFLALAVGGGGLALWATLVREAALLRGFVDRRRAEEAVAQLAAENERLEAQERELTAAVDRELARIVARSHRLRFLQTLLREAAPAPPPPARSARGAPAARLPAGASLGSRTRIEQHLASGGFADVYLARDVVSGFEVVAKVLRRPPDAASANVRRFLLEAAAAAAVKHPAIVRVYEVDVTEDGVPFLVLEHTPGVTLARCIELGALRPHVVVPVLAVVADALAAAHESGIVHRDIKPDNIMVSPVDPGARVLDFGIAAWLGEGDPTPGSEEIVGTPGYLAPECFLTGRQGGPPRDVYATGLTLYESLAGRHPFLKAGALDMIAAQRERPMALLRDVVPDLDHGLCTIVHAMLEKKPEARPTMREVQSELSRWADLHGAPAASDALILLSQDRPSGS